MPKKYLKENVFTAAKKRIKWTFDNFNKIYVSYSGGKDSTVMVHLVMEEAIKRKKKVGILIVDLEGQYKMTIDHLEKTVERYKEYIDLYWVCLPIILRNAVSVYEPRWICWDKDRKNDWIRQPPKYGILDEDYFDFFFKGMEFEEFVPLFGEWYAKGEECACLVGIRADESLNRFRTIAKKNKIIKDGKMWTTKVTENVFNIYPIYDWKTQDIWTYHGKDASKEYNPLYSMMHLAGLTIHQMRICQPYGDDQRRGLYLFHLIEPETWSRVVARVNGANSGALYVQESGNIMGYRKIAKPEGHTWKSFAILLLRSMPPKMQSNYENKIAVFIKWWMDRGYSEGIPNEVDVNLEAKRKVPSWRRVCKSLLRNDYWLKGLGFSQNKSGSYERYQKLIQRKRIEWKLEKIV
jgi:predicted phosphoadenosine phosphosulfate sulfurtransferase